MHVWAKLLCFEQSACTFHYLRIGSRQTIAIIVDDDTIVEDDDTIDDRIVVVVVDDTIVDDSRW